MHVPLLSGVNEVIEQATILLHCICRLSAHLGRSVRRERCPFSAEERTQPLYLEAARAGASNGFDRWNRGKPPLGACGDGTQWGGDGPDP